MRQREAFERVRRADPVDAAGLTDSTDRVAADQLCERIMGQPYTASGPRRREARARGVLLPGAIVAAAAVLGVAVYVTFAPRDGARTPGADVVAGSGETLQAPTLTIGSGGDAVPSERAMRLPGSARLLEQSMTAEAIVWGEVVAVEPARWNTAGSGAAGESGSGDDAPPAYTTYVISPHEVWKGDISAGVPTAFLAVGGIAAADGTARYDGGALPRLHMGDQVVALAVKRPDLGSATADEYWFLEGARSVFRADGDGVFRRLEPVSDDPDGNQGPLSWLRRLLEER